MKKNAKILLVVLLISMLSLLLVGCESQDTSSLDKYYYLLDDDAKAVEVLELTDNNFKIYTLKFEEQAQADDKVQTEDNNQTESGSQTGNNSQGEDLTETEKLNAFLKDIKSNTAERIGGLTPTKTGSFTYTNNAFVVNRLDLTYDGDKGSEYAYLKDGAFAYSPKMPMILLYALIGFCVTLAVLCVLMGVIKLLGFSVDKITAKVKSKVNKTEEGSETATAEVRLAKGSAGELKLENVSDRDAAMIMAIVADQMGEPLNTLRFKSIKDITDQESDK